MSEGGRKGEEGEKGEWGGQKGGREAGKMNSVILLHLMIDRHIIYQIE